MRPYVDLYLEKRLINNSKNSKRQLVFSSRGGSKLANRFISMRFEESDGDDPETDQKGKRDIVTLNFLDEITESRTFLSDTRTFEVGDLIFIEFGWILDSSGASVKNYNSPREFRIVNLETNVSGNQSVLNITAHDRSYDLDMAAIAIGFENLSLGQAIRLLAAQGGLNAVLTTGPVNIFAEGNTELFNFNLVPGESAASYLRNVAEQTSAIFYVENRDLYFGTRIIPKIVKYVFTRGNEYPWTPTSSRDFFNMPFLGFNGKRKLNPLGFKITINDQNKRKGTPGSVENILAKEVEELITGLVVNQQENYSDITEHFQESITDSNDLPEYKKRAKMSAANDLEPALSRSSKDFYEAFDLTNSQISQAQEEQRRLEEVTERFQKVDDEFIEKFSSGPQKMFNSAMVRSIRTILNPKLRESKIKEFEKLILAEYNLKSLTGSLTSLGNPLLQVGQLLTLRGKVPTQYKINWYIRGITHEITANSFTTTVDLSAATPDNPFYGDKQKQVAKQIGGNKKAIDQKTKKNRPDLIPR